MSVEGRKGINFPLKRLNSIVFSRYEDDTEKIINFSVQFFPYSFAVHFFRAPSSRNFLSTFSFFSSCFLYWFDENLCGLLFDLWINGDFLKRGYEGDISSQFFSQFPSKSNYIISPTINILSINTQSFWDDGKFCKQFYIRKKSIFIFTLYLSHVAIFRQFLGECKRWKINFSLMFLHRTSSNVLG